jgi:hypothetical protein
MLASIRSLKRQQEVADGKLPEGGDGASSLRDAHGGGGGGSSGSAAGGGGGFAGIAAGGGSGGNALALVVGGDRAQVGSVLVPGKGGGMDLEVARGGGKGGGKGGGEMVVAVQSSKSRTCCGIVVTRKRIIAAVFIVAVAMMVFSALGTNLQPPPSTPVYVESGYSLTVRGCTTRIQLRPIARNRLVW